VAELSNDPGCSSQGLFEDLPRYFAALRRGRRVLLLVAGLCLALAGVYLLWSPPLYEATTQLLVHPGKGMPAGADAAQAPEGGLPEDFLPTQIEIAGSPEVIKQAIDTVGLDNLPTLKRSVRGGADPAHVAIEKYLKVSQPKKQANVIQVKYRAGSEAEAVRLLTAITDSYQQFLAEHFEHIEVRNKVRAELEDRRALLMGRVKRLEEARTELSLREGKLRGQVELVRKLQETGLWAVAHIMGQLAGDPGDKNGLLAHLSNLAQMISWDYVKQLSLEQQRLADDLGSWQSSKVQELQKKIESAQEGIRKRERAETGDLLRALEGGLTTIEGMRAELDRKIEADKAELGDFLQEARLRDEVENRRKMLNAALPALGASTVGLMGSPRGQGPFLAASALFPGRPTEPRRKFEPITQALEAPNIPERRFWRLYLPVPLVASLFGLAAGAALVLVREVLRPRLRSEAEVREALGLAVVGRLPTLRGRLAVRAGLAAGSRAGERACAALLTNLGLLRCHRPDLKVLLVTGPCRGDGATTTAINLAVGLARAGQRTLLVGADLRQPALTGPHAPGRDRGLPQVWEVKRLAPPVIQRAPVDNLDVLAPRPGAARSTELPLPPRLKAVLGELRAHYDAVILDTPAALESPDACILAPLVDGALLVVRDGVTERRDAEGAVRLFRALDVPFLGAVFNGARGPEVRDVSHIADLLAGVRLHGAGGTRGEGREMVGVGAEQPAAPGSLGRLNHVPHGVDRAGARAPRDPAGDAAV
jgi:Mrp family chromosome partitioning ATPase